MDSSLFHDWFHNNFVPYVHKELQSLGLEERAVLVLDNCSAHPSTENLVSDDGKIFVKFLPANVTALIQPMDYGGPFVSKFKNWYIHWRQQFIYGR